MELQETNNELVISVDPAKEQVKYRRIVSKVLPTDENSITFVAELESDRKWSWKNDVLAFLPESERQIWDCRCCRETFERFATAVVATYIVPPTNSHSRACSGTRKPWRSNSVRHSSTLTSCWPKRSNASVCVR